MEFPIKFDTVKGWSIVYFEGLQAVISKKNDVFLPPRINVASANSADPDEMPHNKCCIICGISSECLCLGVSNPQRVNINVIQKNIKVCDKEIRPDCFAKITS